MLKELYRDQKEYLDYFFDQIDIKSSEEFLHYCLSCKGTIVFSGVGKSGLVAEKIAMTLVSTGTKALFIPPGNLLHGDIGIISRDDLFIMISKSGETKELLDLIPFIRRRETKILAIVSHSASRLALQSDNHICLPLKKELCPFDLAPTTSTVIQLIFGDILAVALMKEKRFSLDQYANNHPAGMIGKKTMLKVKDVMLLPPDLPSCKKNELLVDLLVELSNKKCGCLVITDQDERLEGIFTDGDLRRALQTHGTEALNWPIEKLMTRSALSIHPDILAFDAMKRMQNDPKKWIMVLPVLEKEKVVGIVRLHDIISQGF